ncbi:CDP-alcohol phosphatidyltransferase family protein [Roseiterribacter gracilis]|uniref:CDP-alcohol phosphatidyltransferase n=1 Tax=Roseiterribacter gracilis TaxID=2812848 RepID=A0A8S8X9Y3_9PROT|nr:CDP-alcohol phosphatidyltransferase [Rhodospirillales bacterium TMPK1]
MDGRTWTHKLATPLVRPLLAIGATPNHVTTARLITGLIACGLFSIGTREGEIWGGVLWVVSAFFDRLDGQLARIGNMQSAAGHRYDYMVDNTTTALFFVAIGFGLRHSFLGNWSIPLGILTGVSLLFCNWYSEILERNDTSGKRAYQGAFGFDLDDALYLFGPIAWLGILAPILIAASVSAPIITVITGVRVLKLKREQRSAAAAA